MTNKTFSSSSKENIIRYMLTRKERIKHVHEQIEIEWRECWWSFMMEFEDNINWYYISSHKYITLDFINKHIDKPWDWYSISGNPNITMKDIMDNPDKPWEYFLGVSWNPNLTIEFINANVDKHWHWTGISKNANITLKDIKENPDKPWNWYSISSNPNVTMNDILANPDKPWNWSCISRNPNITMKDILENPDKPWVWYFICKHKNITLKDILENPDKPWVWSSISSNPNLTLEFIKENPDNKWEWNGIFSNPNIKPEDIEENFMIMPWSGVSNIFNNIKKILSATFGIPFKNYRWNDSYVINPNLTMAFIRKYHYKFYARDCISMILFNRDKQDFHLQQYRRHLSAYRIQQHWHRIRLNPHHPVGRKRLVREAEALGFV